MIERSFLLDWSNSPGKNLPASEKLVWKVGWGGPGQGLNLGRVCSLRAPLFSVWHPYAQLLLVLCDSRTRFYSLQRDIL